MDWQIQGRHCIAERNELQCIQILSGMGTHWTRTRCLWCRCHCQVWSRCMHSDAHAHQVQWNLWLSRREWHDCICNTASFRSSWMVWGQRYEWATTNSMDVSCLQVDLRKERTLHSLLSMLSKCSNCLLEEHPIGEPSMNHLSILSVHTLVECILLQHPMRTTVNLFFVQLLIQIQTGWDCAVEHVEITLPGALRNEVGFMHFTFRSMKHWKHWTLITTVWLASSSTTSGLCLQDNQCSILPASMTHRHRSVWFCDSYAAKWMTFWWGRDIILNFFRTGNFKW